MQPRKNQEFELFQQQEHKTIINLKDNINEHKFDKNYDSYFRNSELGLAVGDFRRALLEDEGKKRFIYLLAALLKEGADYEAVQRFAQRSYPSSVGYLDMTPPTIEEERERDLKRQAIENCHRWLHEHIRYAPLLAHSVCSFEEMPTWVTSTRISDPANPYVQLMDRLKLSDSLRCVYEYPEWMEKGELAGVKQLRDNSFEVLCKSAILYSDLLQEINDIKEKNNELTFKIVGAGYVKLAGREQYNIHNIILSLNARDFERMSRLFNSSLNRFSLFSGVDQESDSRKGLAKPKVDEESLNDQQIVNIMRN